MYYWKFEVATFKLNIAKYIPLKANYVVVRAYVVSTVLTQRVHVRTDVGAYDIF